MKILLVEDEPNFGIVMKGYLELSAYQVDWCRNGQQALEQYLPGAYDLCILDVMMPVMDGFTLARHIRKQDQQVPLIFLTARSMKADMLEGFRLGGDDYLTKPFDSELLLCKIKALLKRRHSSGQVSEAQREEYQFGQFIFRTKVRTLTGFGQTRKLSPKEANLLALLCEHKQTILSREKALMQIWQQDDYFAGRSMDVYIARLRKYLKQDSLVQIENIHGQGFCLKVDKEK
jgi:two-component system, OmpR family, response regulator